MAAHFHAALVERPDVRQAALLHVARVSPRALVHVAQELVAIPRVRELPVPELSVLVRRVEPPSHEALVWELQ
jgi:hypothetical protein